LIFFIYFTLNFCSVSRVTTLLGYQPHDLLNKSVYDFFHPEDQTHMKETFDQGKYSESGGTKIRTNLGVHVKL